MERKIGEIFEYNGGWCQCIVGNDCENCAFNERKCYTVVDNGDPIGDCCADRRKDNKDVIFKKLEKVGEPIEYNGSFYQGYKAIDTAIDVCKFCVFSEISCGETVVCDKGVFYVKVKQTKEDMEENHKAEDTLLTRLVGRYVNNLIDYEAFEKAVKELYSDKKDRKPALKEFDLEEAKAGKPVYTRDGRKARIVCYDFKGGDYPIIALVECRGNREIFCAYSEKGEIGIGTKTDEDLMIAPELHEGWVNIYRDADTGRIWASQSIYKTELAAMEFAPKAMGYITAVKIEWEE